VENVNPVKFTIRTAPRTKKNHSEIRYKGERCPVCKRGRPYIHPSEAYDQYAIDAGWFIPKNLKIDHPVSIKYLFYMPTHGIVDQTGLIQAIDDILVHYGVITDDNSRIVRDHDGTRVLYDKENPRTEITITEVQE
jgi:Holliday junction resolvase RusA-like endonuclease